MSRSLDLVPRITRPRLEDGCDYSKPREVVVRMVDGDKLVELHWRPGHKAWAGRAMWEREPGALSINKLPQIHWTGGIRLHEGGRLSRTLLASTAIQESLTTHFGADVAHALKTMKLAGFTLLVTVT